MTLNERLFIVVPLVSLICNLLLLLTRAGLAQKPAGQRLHHPALRLYRLDERFAVHAHDGLARGREFWYTVSITGIFLVPFAIFNFVYRYTESKCAFVRAALLIFWLVITVLNMGNVFITDPHMTVVHGERRFEYGVSPWVALPLLMAVLTLGLAGALICQSCRSGRMQLRQFTPVIAGVAVMFVGTASAALPQMVSLPVDTFSCCVNAVCLYYMLCRRRVVQLRSFATDARSMRCRSSVPR